VSRKSSGQKFQRAKGQLGRTFCWKKGKKALLGLYRLERLKKVKKKPKTSVPQLASADDREEATKEGSATSTRGPP